MKVLEVRIKLQRFLRFLVSVPKGFRYFLHRESRNKGINKFEKRVYSQNGEDGIIDEIFRRIGILHHYFVEFGVSEGIECNSAYLAICKNWNGLMIEGDERAFHGLQRNYESLLGVETRHVNVNRENILSILHDAGVQKDAVDLLSIDIDGNDYWVWKALFEYAARLVVIEFNSNYPPPVRWVMKYNSAHVWDGSTYFGASLTSLTELGKKLGYALIGTDYKDVNAFFLREDLLESSGFVSLCPESAYHQGSIFPRLPYRTGPFESI